MKEYLKQFYSEGLATIFYVKPIAYLSKKITNKELLKVITIIIKIIYTLLALSFATFIFINMV